MKTSRAIVSVDIERDFETGLLRGVDEVLPALLDGFERRGVRAVLFFVGEVAQARPEKVRDAARRGHVLGSHSMTHQPLGQLSPQHLRHEVVDSRRVIEDVAGVACEAFRAPFFDVPPGLGAQLDAGGYRWSSSVAPFSPVAGYRGLSSSRRPHKIPGTHVVEWPVGRWLGAPMPAGLSYLRAFWPLTALSMRPPGMFYLHPHELLERSELTASMRPVAALMSRHQGAWARKRLWAMLDAWLAAGVQIAPPAESELTCVT